MPTLGVITMAADARARSVTRTSADMLLAV